ncbi:hypothetical protein [Okeania sp. KiyG1]|uniref:hypothetical protein n=1 Tax=Okeania sp. KiyG1 TaxID=2720165 RepID=UPI0019230FCB|nr:hypothetical protein [Okeania sp. KiyG1]GGA14013.1 hypothetical protein CYANOKiyG1_27530 [Okeania sp. KiyG1]
MSNYKDWDAKVVSSLSNDDLQVIELQINWGAGKLHAGINGKEIKGQCQLEVSENNLTFSGYFNLEGFEACTSRKTGNKKPDGKDEWIDEAVKLDSEKPCCIVLPKKNKGKELSDFPAFKIVAEKILSTIGDAKAFGITFPLNSVFYDDYYKSELGIADDPSLIDPVGDWKTLTTSLGNKAPRLDIKALTPEEVERVLKVKTPDVSNLSGFKKSYGESTTKKLESKLAFLQANHEAITHLALQLDIEKTEVLKMILS